LPGAPFDVGGAPSPHAGAVVRLDNRDAAVQALKAAERHFADREPSNPCILLIRQALQLVGKSFIEAMHLLVPTRMETAAIQLGASRSLTIPITQLDSFAATDGDAGNAGEAGEAPDGGPLDGEQKTFSADSRSDAVNLIAAAERYFVEFEPSSPVPLLLAGARSYVNRDFSSLLNEFAPPPPPE
jgi:type VI secretion system protein ImpA